MKIGFKLIAGFLVVALLVGIVGYVGINLTGTVHREFDEVTEETIPVIAALEDIRFAGLRIISSTNEFVAKGGKEEAEKHLANEGVQLYDKSIKLYEELVNKFFPDEKEFLENIKITGENLKGKSNEVLSIYEEIGKSDIKFDEAYQDEKTGRYNIRTPIFAIDDRQLTEDVGYLQYYSKETLYQQKDQEHLDDWLASIEKVKTGVVKSQLSEEEKNNLLSELNDYKVTAANMGQIVILNEQKTVEAIELLELFEQDEQAFLMAVKDALEHEDEELEERHDNVDSGLETASNTILIVGILTFIIAVVIGLFISRSISKPIQELTKASEELKKGNLNYEVKVTSKDEIGELAETFEQMRLKIKNDYQRLNLTLIQNLKRKINELQETKQKLKKKSKVK